MGLISEFKEFALKGSVVDLAVGVVIGAAFGNIVNSLVKDVMMPPLGLLMGGVDFSDKKIILRNAVYDAKDIAHAAPITPEVDLMYGRFINNVIQFLIIAIAIFMVIKLMNSAKRKPAPAPAVPPAPTKEEILLAEIRDAIRAKN